MCSSKASRLARSGLVPGSQAAVCLKRPGRDGGNLCMCTRLKKAHRRMGCSFVAMRHVCEPSAVLTRPVAECKATLVKLAALRSRFRVQGARRLCRKRQATVQLPAIACTLSDDCANCVTMCRDLVTPGADGPCLKRLQRFSVYNRAADQRGSLARKPFTSVSPTMRDVVASSPCLSKNSSAGGPNNL